MYIIGILEGDSSGCHGGMGKVRSPKEKRDKELSRAKKKADRHNIKKGGRENGVRSKAHVFCPVSF